MSEATTNNVVKNSDWWKRRSTLEKSLVIISTLGGITIILLAITLNVISKTFLKEVASLKAEALQQLIIDNGINTIPVDERNSKFLKIGKRDEYCLTPGCIHSASSVLNHMDLSVEPCDDFYNYACGKFTRETNIPDDKTSVDTFSETDDILVNQLRMILTEPMRPDEIQPLQLVKKFYNLCMDEEKIGEDGLQPLLKLLQKLGGYPALDGDSWDAENFWTIEKAIEIMQQNKIESRQIIEFSVTSDSKNSSLRIIDIDSVSLGLDREYLVNGTKNELVLAYYNYMVDIAVLLGAERSRVEAELMDTLLFEIELAKITLPQEERRNQTLLYNPMTIKDMQDRFPFLNWLKIVQIMLSSTDLEINEDEIVVVEVPSYMESLGAILQKTPKRTIANYFIRRLIQSSVKYLSNDLRDRKLDYLKVLNGQQMQEPRWRECVDLVADSLQIAVGALYIRNFFKEESKEAAIEIVENLQKVFTNDIKNINWMDETTKKLALDKAQNMNNHIGYPSELMDDKKIEEYYKTFMFGNNSTFLNEILRLGAFFRMKEYSKLRLPVNKTDWTEYSHVAVVNAYYSSLDNGIQFPAGILQGHFFSYDRPKYMNYGSFGFIAGHEITHGFDDEGRQLDKHGDLVDWWQPETHQKFVERAQCIIDQYGNYTDPEVNLKLNGINTQGENIADNGGLKHSYKAYMEWTKKNGPESKLPGIDLSANQMFWVSAAQSWCARIRPESLKVKITTYHHSPGLFRVLGSISNRPEFAKDFNCPQGSPMNPIKKCEVW